MEKPAVNNFLAIDSDDYISIRCYLSLQYRTQQSETVLEKVINEKTAPLENINFFGHNKFRIKIYGINDQQKVILEKEFTSESYGLFNIKIPNKINKQKITRIQIYETLFLQGIEILLGNYIPLRISSPKKIIISDFDKTLVDTRYSTAREMMQSLRYPVSHFPTVDGSVYLFKSYIQENYQPFVLSASPHFYEKTFRDWLYQKHIYNAGIFLKDYSKLLSFFESELTTKDLKKQGFYKLQSLVQILLMTGIPSELVLMGDGFESDPTIYLTLRSILVERLDPWIVWKSIRRLEDFQLNTRQQAQFLTYFHQLASQAKDSRIQDVKIFIRCKQNNIESIRSNKYPVSFLEQQRAKIEFYVA